MRITSTLKSSRSSQSKIWGLARTEEVATRSDSTSEPLRTRRIPISSVRSFTHMFVRWAGSTEISKAEASSSLQPLRRWMSERFAYTTRLSSISSMSRCTSVTWNLRTRTFSPMK